jgi:hypothetical protein
MITDQALAPQRLVWAVGISVRWSLARRTSQGFSRSPRTDQSNGSGELPLGCTANPRRAAHAWVQGFPGDRIPLLGARAPKSRAIVADVIRNQALAFRYRDDLEYSNQDSQSRPDCSCRGNLTRSARQIAKLGTGSRWLSQPRGLVAPPRLCARSASLRTFRYSTAPGRSSTAGANPVSVSVRMRGPPRHTTRSLKAEGSPVCGPSFEKGQV